MQRLPGGGQPVHLGEDVAHAPLQVDDLPVPRAGFSLHGSDMQDAPDLVALPQLSRPRDQHGARRHMGPARHVLGQLQGDGVVYQMARSVPAAAVVPDRRGKGGFVDT
ncbi:hypothetical protein ACFY6U_32265 [Streptomyces sp. NPDC013157]|uniref:hypothetical protein n=1 Tax=Streptomyces sp. NPDC013157 TaxID=3364861 RepID=UPI0036A3FF96